MRIATQYQCPQKYPKVPKSIKSTQKYTKAQKQLLSKGRVLDNQYKEVNFFVKSM